MRKIINILILIVIGFSAVSCYQDAELPEKFPIYSDADFKDQEYISILDFKKKYSKLDAENGSELITEDLYLKGKVISSDEKGNIYKSLFIQEHYDNGRPSSAIELRLFASNFVKYPLGTTIYVKLKGLTAGYYRAMLSIGEKSNDPKYATSNIESPITLANHIFSGKILPMESRDTLVINASNYKDIPDSIALGRLVRIEGVESCFGASGYGFNNDYPSYFSATDLPSLTYVRGQWLYGLGYEESEWDSWTAPEGWKPTLGWINPENNKRYYGSAWFSYDKGSSSILGSYVIRTSAYSRFYSTPIPENGTKVNITAIYTRYSKSHSDYSNSSSFEASQRGSTYQLTLIDGEGLEIL